MATGDTIDTMATTAEAEAEQPQVYETYDVIERDTVPAPQPRPGETLADRIAKLLQWLQPTDFLSPGGEFLKHLHSHAPRTGEWFYASSAFRAWAGLDPADRNSNNNNDDDDDDDDEDDDDDDNDTGSGSGSGPHLLHVRGVAGSGKSVLAAHTIRRLQQQGVQGKEREQEQEQEEEEEGKGHGAANAVVLFFFFRQIVDKNHTARFLVRDFAAQLLPRCPPLVAALEDLSAEHAVRGIELELLWPRVVEAVGKWGEGDDKTARNVYVVVDALDEMDDAELEGMVERLLALGTGGRQRVRLRVMVTSRPLPCIEQALDHPGVMKLRLDPARLSLDVARYVDARMVALEPPLSEERRTLVKQAICERAGGLFLQARLMADNLAEGLRDGRITPETLPDSLDRLPRTLSAVYEDLLKEHARRSGVTAEQQAKLLMCVTHASRPLRLIELGSLLARMLRVDLARGKDLVRAGCGRLLELLEDETVSVIHHSFTEFLHDRHRKEDEEAFPVLDDETSHAMMAALLLEYLDGCPHFDATIDDQREVNYEHHAASRKEEERRDKIRKETRLSHPLASYAIDNFFFHISKVAPGTASANQVLEALDRYLVPGQPAFETWVLMNWSGQLSASFTVFHLITAAPEGDLIPAYVLEHFADKEPALLDSKDADGLTPLAHAARNGYGHLAKVLLARGADPTSGGNDGQTPLHWAAAEGKSGVVRLLLDAGVDPLVKTWPVLSRYNPYEDWVEEYTEEEAEAGRETALAFAFNGDDTEVIKAFMPFIPPEEINKCFHRVRGAENVKALLETGKVDVDCFCSGRTKLYEAARSRKLDVIKLLLEHGADPNRRCTADGFGLYRGKVTMEIGRPDCERGPTPLHGFAGVGYERHILLEGEEKTAADCLRVLIEAGADVDATMDTKYDGEDLTPLHLAVQKTESTGIYWGSLDQSEETLVKLLLSAGANPNAKTKGGNAPIHLANPEKLRVFELLVEHGADINARNARGRPPLFEMINRLGHQTVLHRAEPDVSVFNKLLELGADVHLVDNQGSTIFHHLIHSIGSFVDPTFLPFIENLLATATVADLNRRDKHGQPPLWKYISCRGGSYSSPDGDEPVLRALVEAGMDLNVRDEQGRTFLWELAKRSGIEVPAVDKFVRLGADPTIVAHDGQTLLHSAVEHAKPAAWLRYLISAGVRADLADHRGDTVLHALLRAPYSTHNAAREALAVLLEAGAPPLALNAKRQSPLHVARDWDRLDMVLGNPAFRGLDVGQPDADGLSPLHHAAALAQFADRAVWKLLRAGADPAATTAPGALSPLHVAARRGDAAVVGMLLARYRELGVLEGHVNRLGNGRAPLHYACGSGSPEAVWLLLRDGADARMRDGEGLTPLHVLANAQLVAQGAAAPRAGDIAWMLIQAGADVNAEAAVRVGDDVMMSRKGVTALDMAVQRKSWKLVRRLIENGAEPRDEHRQSEEFILATDKDKAAERAREAQAKFFSETSRVPARDRRWQGRWAAGMRAPEKGTHFISCGQDILDATDHEDDDGGDDDVKFRRVDVLVRVLWDGDYDSIKEYAQLGGDLLELTSLREYTFLHYLVREGRVELLDCFGDAAVQLEAQEWVQADKKSCGTLLGEACKRSLPSLHVVQLLVDKLGVDVNAAYNGGSSYSEAQTTTALHILARGTAFWQVEALEYLLVKGADIEARDERGLTPLLEAVSTGAHGFWREETMRVLLRHGADVNATVDEATMTGASRGSSAIERSNQPGITKLLLEHGASVKSCPGILARAITEWMEPEIVSLLLDAGADPNELQFLEEEQKKGSHSVKSGRSAQKDEEEEEADHDYVEVTTNPDLRYPLHEAARPTTPLNPPFDFRSRQQAVMDLLLSHGADVFAPYPDRSFVLQAVVEDRGEAHSLLGRVTQANCNRRGHHGRTLLISASIPFVPFGAGISYSCSRTNKQPTVMPDVILSLLNSGADPLAVDDEGRTPLHWFCTFPGPFDDAHRTAFVALVAAQNNNNNNHNNPTAAAAKNTDAQGRTPLHLALATYASGAQRSPFAIEHLLSSACGADPADPEPDPDTGNTALHSLAPRLVGEPAAAAQAAALFRALAGRPGADINARNAAGETPAFCFAAAWLGEDKVENPTTHAEVLDMFVELGADLTATDARGRTLLHVAAEREESEETEAMFKRLMELGVDPLREDGGLRTALDVAVARNMVGIVRLFGEEGKRVMEEKEEEGEEEEGEDKESCGFKSELIS